MQNQNTITLTISVDDLNVLLEGLGELPAKRSHRMLNVLQVQALQQLNAQAKPAQEQVAEKVEGAGTDQIEKARQKRERKALKLPQSNGHAETAP